MARTTPLRSNRSQAVRLPKDVAFPASVREVVILRDGERRVVAPADASWDDFFDSPGIEIEREQPPPEEPADRFDLPATCSISVRGNDGAFERTFPFAPVRLALAPQRLAIARSARHLVAA
jgi:antitoxin VapB